MPAHWVIHTVGPNYRRGHADRDLLASCYKRCLEVADELGARTLAFPLVGAGAYGWPLADAVDIAVNTAASHLTDDHSVQFVAFGDPEYDLLVEAVKCRLLLTTLR